MNTNITHINAANIDENRVRELAYQIWESEGRPSGEASRHWEMACERARGEPDRGRAKASKPKTTKKSGIATAEKPAFANASNEVASRNKKGKRAKEILETEFTPV